MFLYNFCALFVVLPLTMRYFNPIVGSRIKRSFIARIIWIAQTIGWYGLTSYMVLYRNLLLKHQVWGLLFIDELNWFYVDSELFRSLEMALIRGFCILQYVSLLSHPDPIHRHVHWFILQVFKFTSLMIFGYPQEPQQERQRNQNQFQVPQEFNHLAWPDFQFGPIEIGADGDGW